MPFLPGCPRGLRDINWHDDTMQKVHGTGQEWNSFVPLAQLSMTTMIWSCRMHSVANSNN
jgi:hypothetical protein